MDPEDVRESSPPCRGTHDISADNCRIKNQHACVAKCRECGIRMLYVPVKGSSGDSRKPTPLDQKTRMQRPELWRQGNDQTQTPPAVSPKAKQRAKTPPRHHHRAEYHSIADFALAEDEDAYETPGGREAGGRRGRRPGNWGRLPPPGRVDVGHEEDPGGACAVGEG